MFVGLHLCLYFVFSSFLIEANMRERFFMKKIIKTSNERKPNMSKKETVRYSNRSRDERGRRKSVGRRPHDRSESRGLYSSERYEQRGSKSRKSSAARPHVNGLYERQRRPIQQKRMRGGYGRTREIVVHKSAGAVLFSFLANFLFYGITLGIIMMAVMFSFSSKSTASIFGYRFYTVLTNSMVPQKAGPEGGFYAGDIVIVKLADGSKVEKNDIVTFSVGDGSRYLTHRMIERRDELNGEKGDFIVTKGDANTSKDPPIPADRVLGKVVFALPKVGDILEFIRKQFWACLVSVLSLYGFILVIKAYLISPNEQHTIRRRTIS